ncbi:MAG: PDZ domain-containing protein [Campylobacterales bacterium]|nr:PDZ domain-containing protein [Campylobacterales bacterium]
MAIKTKLLGLTLGLTLCAWAQEAPTVQDFEACFNRNKPAYVSLEGVRAIAITPTRAISFERPRSFVKYDPFLNLYVLRSPTPLSPVPQNEERALKRGEWLASVSAKPEISIGKLSALASGLGQSDTFSANSLTGAIVTGVCCDMYGVAKKGGSFIGNRYLEHVVAYDEVYYGDVGARFAQQDAGIVVVQVDPFYASGLRQGDRIVRVNRARVGTLQAFNETVLFAPKNTTLPVEVMRGTQSVQLSLHVRPKRAISLARETYLEALGLHFDANLALTRVEAGSWASAQGLHVGDTLVQIDRQPLKNPQEIRTLLGTLSKNKPYYMLFDRKGFQFFVTLTISQQ